MSLKEELQRRGLKQVRVAFDLGIDRVTFCGLCNGWIRPTPEHAAKISGFLGVDAAKIFPARQRATIEMRGLAK